MFEIVYDDDDGRTTDGRRLDGYPISSPCEPNGSGELNQRTNGPVNAHLISWPSKAQIIQNLEKYMVKK